MRPRPPILLALLGACGAPAHDGPVHPPDAPGPDTDPADVVDTDRAPDTDRVPDTGDAPRDTDPPAGTSCADPAVAALLAALPSRGGSGCGHAWIVVAASAGARELVLSARLDTTEGHLPRAAPYVAGQRFSVDLATAPRTDGGASLTLVDGRLAIDLCNDDIEEAYVVRRRWAGVAGTLSVEVQEPLPGTENVPGDQPFRGAVEVRGLVLEDDVGDRCEVPDARWDDVHLGWTPG